jgi:hypothetical protein
LIVTRSVYGKNTNRFYCHGLARAEKLKWRIEKIDGNPSYSRAESPRAIFKGYGRLVPPQVWKLQRGVRVRVRNLLQRGTSPEAVDHIMPEVRELVARVGRPLIVSAVPKTAEEIERNRRAYQHVARIEPARTDHSDRSEIPPPPFLEEVSELLVNSCTPEERGGEHDPFLQRAPPSRSSSMAEEAAAAEASEKHRADFLARRARKRLDEQIERLRKHMEEAKKNGRD